MTLEPMVQDQPDTGTVEWAPDAPRGGRAVMGRILKENATVPLFFGQTMIQSLRDVGYNHTTSALCEHVDNALQAGATEIRVYFRQTGKRGDYQIDAAVCDNGSGMSSTVLKVATSFGGSTTPKTVPARTSRRLALLYFCASTPAKTHQWRRAPQRPLLASRPPLWAGRSS
jgi:hypothetical protein